MHSPSMWEEPEHISELEPLNFTSHLRTSVGLIGSSYVQRCSIPRDHCISLLGSSRGAAEVIGSHPNNGQRGRRRTLLSKNDGSKGTVFSAEDMEILDVDCMFSKELCTLAFWYVNMSKYGSWGRNRGDHKYVVMCKDTYLMKAYRYGYLAKSTALHMTFSPTWHDH